MKRFPKPRRIFSRKALSDTWKSTRGNVKKKSRGVDDETKAKFEESLSYHIRELSFELVEGVYRPSLLFAKALPKPNSPKKRIICIPTIRDRLAQRTALKYLVEGDKLGVRNSISFGSLREDGGLSGALKKARRKRRSKLWALKTDISSFFDRINRDLLISDIERRLGQSSLVPFLSNVVQTEIDCSDNFIRNEAIKNGIVSGEGLRQGMPLSPLLSNFVLRRFDAFFTKRQIDMIRYADDLLVFCRTETECEESLLLLSEQLEELYLEVPSLDEGGKTKIFSPCDSLDFLGYVISGIDDQCRIKIPDEAYCNLENRLKELSSFQLAFRSCRRLTIALKKIDDIASGYGNSYGMAENSEKSRFAAHISNQRDSTVTNLLKSTFGKSFLDSAGGMKREFLGVS